MISIHAQKFTLLDAENNETLENILKAPHKKYHAITCPKLGGKLYQNPEKLRHRPLNCMLKQSENFSIYLVNDKVHTEQYPEIKGVLKFLAIIHLLFYLTNEIEKHNL